MKLPSKVTTFKKSILVFLPKILGILSEKDYSINRLYYMVSKEMSINEFIDSLDCLFMLGKVTINMEVLHYVKRD